MAIYLCSLPEPPEILQALPDLHDAQLDAVEGRDCWREILQYLEGERGHSAPTWDHVVAALRAFVHEKRRAESFKAAADERAVCIAELLDKR